MNNELERSSATQQEWDFHQLSLRNKMQIEVMQSLGVSHDEAGEWMALNAPILGDIIDNDTEFHERVEAKDWQGAKEVLVQKLEAHHSVV